jgi:hypothetical protein
VDALEPLSGATLSDRRDIGLVRRFSGEIGDPAKVPALTLAGAGVSLSPDFALTEKPLMPFDFSPRIDGAA